MLKNEKSESMKRYEDMGRIGQLSKRKDKDYEKEIDFYE